MAEFDPYAELGLDDDAAEATIRATYRQLARTFHPDHATGSTERMARINQAYELLSDPARRCAYDSKNKRTPHFPESPPRQASPAPEPPPTDEQMWGSDLLEHVEDWRYMYAEERHRWEQMLAAHPPGSAGANQAAINLTETRRLQLLFENTVLRRLGEPPTTAEEFEESRSKEKLAADQRRSSASQGCGTTLIVSLALGLSLLLDRLFLGAPHPRG